jgi:hypothetical protein
MELNTPFYVKITGCGPNNTSHPLHKDTKLAYFNGNKTSPKTFQTFKIVKVDNINTSHNKLPTYLTEDGYCLWSFCVQDCTEEEYNTERKLNFILLIFN